MAKILIIDDEVNIIELAKLYLQREGFAVETANNGQDGLTILTTISPDLIILDIMLPEARESNRIIKSCLCQD